MKDQLLHTPDGVRDIYNSECEQKLFLQDCLFREIRKYGYGPIQTPSFEFFDVFGKEIGTTPSKELYKFFDRDGNTLVLRPDITPSIARVAAKYYKEEAMPVRFSYCGNTFTNNSNYQGRLKETTQLGAELVGDRSVAADAEIIAMTARCFLRAGLSDFQISVGDCGFFRSICAYAQMEEETIADIRNFICSKNYFAAQEVVSELEVSSEVSTLFEKISSFMGEISILEEAKGYVKNIPGALSAIARLEELYEILKTYGCEQYVSFDLGLLSKYDYYTGIIFEGYTFGSGEAVAKGGRYDELVRHFGKDAPAVGCVIFLDQLLLALSRQRIEVPMAEHRILFLYTESQRADAIAKADALRAEGETVQMMCIAPECQKEDYVAYASRNRFDEVREC